MTDGLVADHNRSMNVITGEPYVQYILYSQDTLIWTREMVSDAIAVFNWSTRGTCVRYYV